jgi:hypothetical protein
VVASRLAAIGRAAAPLPTPGCRPKTAGARAWGSQALVRRALHASSRL